MTIFENLPTSRYNTLVIDPPWPQTMTGTYKRRRHSRANALPYSTLSLDEIASFPLQSLCNPGSHVYVWVTNKFLPAVWDILDGWGLHYHLTLPLIKKSGIVPCKGYVFASEFCILAFSSRPHQPFSNMGKLNWLTVNPKAGTHSAKPESFYTLTEHMSPAPRLDIFARQARPWWGDAWGNEIPNYSISA